jgi:hypothetical protein
MKISNSQKVKSFVKNTENCKGARNFTMNDIPTLTSKIFSEFDKDKIVRFTIDEFSLVIRALIDFVGRNPSHGWHGGYFLLF